VNILHWKTAASFSVSSFDIHIVFCFGPGVDAKKYPTVELIRRKNAGEPLEDSEDKNALPRGKHTWTGGNWDSNGLVSWVLTLS